MHVCTTVCTCHTHTTHTYTHTQHTHLFRSLCLHFGCMRTPGGTQCRHLHSTAHRSRVRFFVKPAGGMWSVCDRSWISLCCLTCRTCPGPHTAFTKFIMCESISAHTVITTTENSGHDDIASTMSRVGHTQGVGKWVTRSNDVANACKQNARGIGNARASKCRACAQKGHAQARA